MSAPSPEKTPTDSSRRRSSGGTGMFANLQQVKRNPDTAAYEQRRQSISEQTTQKPGVIGNMFNNVFKGPSKEQK